ncbi:MAG: hypothetical protein QOH41_1515 [Blastocatellia bacterium]|nr:hypothetical protein [Blastocatellia bacterium]
MRLKNPVHLAIGLNSESGSSRNKEDYAARLPVSSEASTLVSPSLMWHAHLARGFNVGTPVPLFKRQYHLTY